MLPQPPRSSDSGDQEKCGLGAALPATAAIGWPGLSAAVAASRWQRWFARRPRQRVAAGRIGAQVFLPERLASIVRRLAAIRESPRRAESFYLEGENGGRSSKDD